MKHIWSIICENSSVDSDNNLMSIFNCLEELQLVLDKTKIENFETIKLPITLQVISNLLIDKEILKFTSFDIKIEFVDPTGKVLLNIVNKIPVKSGIKRYRNRMNIQGLPITKSGTYYFLVSKKEGGHKIEKVAELPLDINIIYK